MELSPEDRQRIYLEEKARLEAQEQLAKEKEDGQKKSSRTINRLMVIVGVLMAVIIIAAIVGSKEPKKPGSQTYEAQVMAEKFIKGRLRAPGTAEFGGERVAHLGGEKYLVTGYVDAQNAFGAKLRNQWICTVEQTGETQWTRSEPCALLE